jgi:hypothetical protein
VRSTSARTVRPACLGCIECQIDSVVKRPPDCPSRPEKPAFFRSAACCSAASPVRPSPGEAVRTCRSRAGVMLVRAAAVRRVRRDRGRAVRGREAGPCGRWPAHRPRRRIDMDRRKKRCIHVRLASPGAARVRHPCVEHRRRIYRSSLRLDTGCMITKAARPLRIHSRSRAEESRCIDAACATGIRSSARYVCDPRCAPGSARSACSDVSAVNRGHMALPRQRGMDIYCSRSNANAVSWHDREA